MGDISNEPTMEEILSSIKKIIAEDGEKSLSAPRPRRSVSRDPSHDELGNSVSMVAEGPRREDDVLELTEMATEEVMGHPVSQQFVEPKPQPAPSPFPQAVAPAPIAQTAPEIVSQVTATASRSALDSLSAVVVKPSVNGADTLEGMVREMLRPMLKDWLDARLPEMVEAMVAKEIARITGR